MARVRRKTTTWMDPIETLADLCFKIGGLLLLLFVGYLLFGIFSGGLAGFMTLPYADRLRVLANVQMACKAVSVIGILFTLGVVIRFRQDEGVGYALAVFGFILALGLPEKQIPLLPNLLPEKYRPEYLSAQNVALVSVLSQLRFLGLTFLVPGIILSFRDMLSKIRGLWSQKPTGKVVWGEENLRKQPIYGSCWDMVFCREFIREFCPAYEAGKACWKVKCGCYCDERTILQALKYQGNTGGGHYKEVAYSLGTPQKSKLTPAQKRKRCRSCMLFLEHQRQKYQLMAPAVMLTVGVMMWQGYPLIRFYFDRFISAAEYFVKQISFKTAAAAAAKTQVSPAVTGDGSEVVFLLFVVWLSIVILSYALRGLEYFIFKLKI